MPPTSSCRTWKIAHFAQLKRSSAPLSGPNFPEAQRFASEAGLGDQGRINPLMLTRYLLTFCGLLHGETAPPAIQALQRIEALQPIVEATSNSWAVAGRTLNSAVWTNPNGQTDEWTNTNKLPSL